jgi:hypothetical protein
MTNSANTLTNFRVTTGKIERDAFTAVSRSET